MRLIIGRWIAEFIILASYMVFYEFVLLKEYMDIFTYLFVGVMYHPNIVKIIISAVLFFFFSLLLLNSHSEKNRIYDVFIRFVFCICIIPMLSVYACFEGIDQRNVLYPTLFFLLLIAVLKYYSSKEEGNEIVYLRIPHLKHTDYILLVLCATCAVMIWAISGFPIALNFDIAYERRMSLRMEALPSVLNYLFMFIGGTALPYLFAKTWTSKRFFSAGISLVTGIILFFVNGMKTWLLLYPLFLGIALICKMSGNKEQKMNLLIDSMFLLISVGCVAIYKLTGHFDLMSQFARVTAIPNNIGFRSIGFFKENELLYLRESILRVFWSTPYEGGSDFYINYGADSTITSSRANNGLWGDAFRNFGLVGILIYPFFIGQIFRVIEVNCRGQEYKLRVFIMFLVLWSSINTSFFTWLLTGGVIIIVLMAKTDITNDRIFVRDEGFE